RIGSWKELVDGGAAGGRVPHGHRGGPGRGDRVPGADDPNRTVRPDGQAYVATVDGVAGARDRQVDADVGRSGDGLARGIDGVARPAADHETVAAAVEADSVVRSLQVEADVGRGGDGFAHGIDEVARPAADHETVTAAVEADSVVRSLQVEAD